MDNDMLYKKYDYTRLSNRDIISAVQPHLENKGLYLREDGKITSHQKMAHSPPWVYVKPSPVRNCGFWHRVLFSLYNMLPIWCLSCWKVVVRPKTLEDLFGLLETQREFDHPSKCGIEVRPIVHGLYGGYFYNDSKEKGLECWKDVKGLLEKNKINASIILKRGCTEFEMAFGPSTEWENHILPNQQALEERVQSCWAISDFESRQPEHVSCHVMQKWIHWAYQNADPTYIKFNRGEPLFKPVVTYHEEAA